MFNSSLDKTKRLVIFAVLTFVPMLFQPMMDQMLGSSLPTDIAHSPLAGGQTKDLIDSMSESGGDSAGLPRSKPPSPPAKPKPLVVVSLTAFTLVVVLFGGKLLLDRTVPEGELPRIINDSGPMPDA